MQPYGGGSCLSVNKFSVRNVALNLQKTLNFKWDWLCAEVWNLGKKQTEMDGCSGHYCEILWQNGTTERMSSILENLDQKGLYTA